MSDRLKKTNNISNEEVIDDLTKDLEFSLRSQGGVVNNDHAENSGSGDSAMASPSVDIPFKDDNLDDKYEESDNEDMDIDSIDELSLKDAEVGLTDDEKAQRLDIALKIKAEGNEQFKYAEFSHSIGSYTEALRICPLVYSQQRAILYCNRSASRLKIEQYKKSVADSTKALELDDKYIKAYFRRAQAYEAMEKLDESLEDYKKILELDPSHREAQIAMVRLPPLIEIRNEKLKTEMLGKLKDLGNMILKPFGLSTQNFQLDQDPETKGYKINFKQ